MYVFEFAVLTVHNIPHNLFGSHLDGITFYIRILDRIIIFTLHIYLDGVLLELKFIFVKSWSLTLQIYL